MRMRGFLEWVLLTGQVLFLGVLVLIVAASIVFGVVLGAALAEKFLGVSIFVP